MNQGTWNRNQPVFNPNSAFQQSRTSAFDNANANNTNNAAPFGGQQGYQQSFNGSQSAFQQNPSSTFGTGFQQGFNAGSQSGNQSGASQLNQNPSANSSRSFFGSQPQPSSSFFGSGTHSAFLSARQFNTPQSINTPSSQPVSNQPVSNHPSSAFSFNNSFQAASNAVPAFSAVPSGNLTETKKDKKRDERNQRRGDKAREPQKPDNKRSEDRRSNRRKSDVSNPAKPITHRPRFSAGQFIGRSKANLNSDSILKPLPKPIVAVKPDRDSWDVQNQTEMERIEQEYLGKRKSLQSAYEQMAQMRGRERTEMEKRGLVDSTEVRKNLTDAIQFVGSCLDMCPVFERVRRAHENNVLSLEKNNDGRVVKEYAVKAFSRPAAGQPPPLPSDVRPPAVLIDTLKHLVSSVLPKLPASHPFLWDRTRSIRQDFTYQNYQGDEALWCFEIIARVHCVSFHRMAKSVASGGEWSQQQEVEQFNKCLQSLSEFYQSRPLVSSNEAEIRAYQLLSHFFDNELVSTIDRLPPQISRHPLVNLALELRSLARVSVTQFFHRIRKPDIPITFRAIAEIHYNKLRMRAIRQLLESMHKRMSMYSMSRFVKLLGFETHGEARRFCDHFDLIISECAEAGEEVDIRSWDEKNVRDKQAMPQAFDASLDSFIDSYDVSQPLASRGFTLTTPNAPAQQVAPQTAIPKTVVAAPKSAPSQIEVVPPPPSDEEEQRRKKEERERLKLQLQEQQRQKERLEQANRERLRREKAEAEAKAAALARQQEQQRLLEAEHRKQAELEQQRQQQQKLRTDARNQFLDKAKNHLYSQLLQEVYGEDCNSVIRSVKMDNRRLLSNMMKAVKTNAAKSLEKRKVQNVRAQELDSFRSASTRKRVVSARRRKPESSLNCKSDASPFLSFSTDNCLPSESKGFHMEIDRPDSSVQTNLQADSLPKARLEVFSWKPLMTLLMKANGFGLDRIYFAADWTSSEGQWLRETLQLNNCIKLEDNTEVKILKYETEEAVDVGVIETAYDREVQFSLSTRTTAAQHRSLRDLEIDITSVLQKYLDTMQDHLQRHKSLEMKRRRISVPRTFDQRPVELRGLVEKLQSPVKTLQMRPPVALRVKHLRNLVEETRQLARGL